MLCEITSYNSLRQALFFSAHRTSRCRLDYLVICDYSAPFKHILIVCNNCFISSIVFELIENLWSFIHHSKKLLLLLQVFVAVLHILLFYFYCSITYRRQQKSPIRWKFVFIKGVDNSRITIVKDLKK